MAKPTSYRLARCRSLGPYSHDRLAHTRRYHGPGRVGAGSAASVIFTVWALRRMSSIFHPVSCARFCASYSRRVLRSPS